MVIVQAKLSAGAALGPTLESMAPYARQSLKRGQSDAERDALAVARRNTQAMKALMGQLG